MIMSVIMKLIYFDIFYTERWLPDMMKGIGLNFESIENDDPISLPFSESGFESKQFLKNSGSSLVFVILYIIGWIFLFIIRLISSHFAVCLKLKGKLEELLIWNQSINLFQSQLTPIVLSSMINLYDLRI